MILVRNATLLDPATGALTEGASVLVIMKAGALHRNRLPVA